MAHKGNIHHRKKNKSQRQPVVASQPHTSTLSAASSGQPASQSLVAPMRSGMLKTAEIPVEVRFAELPYELRRIALYGAFVVILLVILWFFLR